ncbi:MAG: DNA-3-methyladenine glycosylase I [Gammaproteobacteria bacterium]|nr:DNA-3-methyladenine glycosylase I [Gammaproteobacteria bacterium]
MANKKRCWWCGESAIYCDYHDAEWGVPLHDERALFELLCLEGAQAGLSWLTILNKRAHYRRVFDNFDAEKMATYGDAKIAALLRDPGIVRNRLKVNGFVKNARAFLRLRESGATLDEYLWGFVDGTTLQNYWTAPAQVPDTTPLSDRMAKDMKKRGFVFVGSTICYAFMQSAGLVNDHLTDCFRHRELGGDGSR